ncbi:hypothetical protein F4808DRAFT_441256 [Astrocystis sublimbata]|nr:hypothetical protein F4808DRAFT_441256 [Astrocystis sublimbata]
MSFPTASTPSPASDRHDSSFASSQASNTENSTLCFESSFRLEAPFHNQKAESEKHPKGKRKRTTSQDKTVLEAAYNSNPKPDKAARLDIVKRVSLNEKEVQIWFQNRRQNDRRKSRPLSPQEIEALRYGNGMRVLSSNQEPLPSSIEPLSVPVALPNAAELSQGSPMGATAATELDGHFPVPLDAVSRNTSRPASPQDLEATRPSSDVRTDSEVGNPMTSRPPSPPRIVESKAEPQPHGGVSETPTGHMTSRWFNGDSFSTPGSGEKSFNDSFRYGDTRPSIGSGIDVGNSRLNSFSSSTTSAPEYAPTLPPHSSSSSKVRLSLSLDGKAELISAQQSPTRPTPQMPIHAETLPPVFTSNRTLQRSRSALSGITLPPISTLTKNLSAPFPPQFAPGRSRDVHAWESCCEADTRDELTRQAENESSGSAIAAISLVRSSSSSASLSNLIHNHPHSQPHSHSGILQPNTSKRNTLGAPRVSLDRKPRLARAKTSPPATRFISIEASGKLADLEADEDPLEPEKKRRKHGSQFDIFSPSGDSDKENWSPGENGNPSHQRPLPLPDAGASPTKQAAALPKNPRRVGRVLGEQDAPTKRLFQDARSRHMNRASTAPTLGQRLRKVGDAAVAIFEDGEIAKAAAREGKDVDRFMGSRNGNGNGETSPGKRPDMDVVAGLLSLSQGNWR